VIQLNDVSRTYAMEQPLTVLRDVNLRIGAGDFVAILGPSGSGKSTMLHIMGLLDRPTTGTVRVNGVDTSTLSDDARSELRGRSIGFVFQSFQLISHLSVAENVELPLFYQRVPAAERRARSLECLCRVQLDHRADHLPSELSGGECQRTAVARALVADAPLIFADEPTGNLDTRTGDEVFGVFKSLHEQGRAVVVITHDVSLADRIPRTVRLSDGEIVEDSRDSS
jgi:putative ABC transport system ATP-binding protein